jgi:biopolymer transport protein ExbB
VKPIRDVLLAVLTFGSPNLCCPLPAQGPAGGETVRRLARSAEDQLGASIKELNSLREQIAAEKVPLAQELTALEEKVARLRKEHDQVTRDVDNGSLELASLKGDTKGKKDEIAYVSGLLDEYVRSFEGKIHPCETQRYARAIESAKQAKDSVALSASERLDGQSGFAAATLERLSDSIGGARFEGVAVDAQGSVVSGRYAVVGPVAVFRADGGQAGLAIAQTGSTKPLLRPLEGALQSGIGPLVQDGQGVLPVDPSRGGALKALVQKTNLIHLFEKGGPIMWPLLLASVLALGTVLERVLFLASERRKRDPKSREALFAAVGRGDLVGAAKAGEGSKDYVIRTLVYALTHTKESLPNALLYAQSRELKRFRRGIAVLDTVITLAPLLGLLGTVTGMMGSFSLLGGELSAPGAITGGIAEALIATAFGLGIAITALLPFNFLNTKLDEATSEIESAATQLELLVHQHHPSIAPAPIGVDAATPALELAGGRA